MRTCHEALAGRDEETLKWIGEERGVLGCLWGVSGVCEGCIRSV